MTVMRKKLPVDRDENLWALTLADMMMLLLCFFVIMLAIAKVDQQAYSTVAKSLSRAMGGKQKNRQGSSKELTGSVQSKRDIFSLKQELSRLLQDQKSAVTLSLRTDSVAIRLRGNIFFASGSAELTSRARQVLAEVAPVFREISNPLTIEGHTDDVPIKSSRYPSNWELSAARAASVARFFIARDTSPERIEVVGLADTKPLFPNRTADGQPIVENQASNRRVVILVSEKEKSASG